MNILLVDDEKNILKTLTVTLQGWGHQITPAMSVPEALQCLKDKSFDFVLTDFKLENKTGIEVLRAAKKTFPNPIVVLMTAYASFENAVNSVKEGAYDYIAKPFSNAQLEMLVQKVQSYVDLRAENEHLKSAQYRSDFFSGMTSPAMMRLEEFVRKVAPTQANLLLVGESGTGKTELARLIHARSDRYNRPFVVVNCTTLTENLIESELFGHVRGAFTGATQDHLGKLECANHGTILIDEIGELSPNGQMKLLRFLQEKIVERVGSNKAIPLDVRVIAATNRDLEEAVTEGKFREDLYFRLNIFESNLVPLRFREEDIPLLIQRFFKEFLTREGKGETKRIPEMVLRLLEKYDWPGNVREMRNVLERILLLSQDREIQLEDLPANVRSGVSKTALGANPLKKLEDVERAHIEKVLATENNLEHAAEVLGITTVTLWRKRKQYGLI